MHTLGVIVLLISGIIFIGSVMLMNPKGGLGIGIGGIAGGGGEYGSKKSIENTLKKAALISAIIFLVTVLVLPYIA